MDDLIKEIAEMIDHSLLNPTITDKELEDGCKIAEKYDVASVCVKPYHVKRAKELLKNSSVKVGTVVGFPHGGHKTEVKIVEAKEALKDGAEELDMVLNIGALLSNDFELVEDDIRYVVDLAHSKGAIVKVIFENYYLKKEQKIKACQICEKVGVDFVKTSTGYAKEGYTPEDIELMRENVSSKVQIKAAHGVRTLDDALRVKELGCTRFGATKTVEILELINFITKYFIKKLRGE